MPTVTTVLATYDSKYEAKVWREDVAETFQKRKQTTTDYTVADGQVVKTIETTFEFASALAFKSPQLPDPPATFLYSDTTYRKDPAFIFQKTHIKTTTYAAYGDTAYQAFYEDYDVLTGETTRSSSIVDGKIPLAPTVNSALSNLILQPIQGELDDNCDFIGSSTVIDGLWLEDGSDAAKAARRRLQRDTAIVRRVKHAANPLMRIGHTVQLIAPKRGLNGRHVLVRKTTTLGENGGADQISEMEFWVR